MSGFPPTLAEIAALWRAAWPERVPHPRGLAARLADSGEWLWRRGPSGDLIAFAACRAPESHPHGHLRLLLVHPDHRRRGLGRGLVAEARNRLALSGMGSVPLALGEERGHFFPGAPAESLPFWEAVGFARTGRESVDMRRNLRGLEPYALPAPYRLTDAREAGVLDGVLALTDAVFSPRWTFDARTVGTLAPRQVLALCRGDEVLGFALTGTEDDPAILPSFLSPQALRRGLPGAALVGGLGPVGLHPALRGEGLGRGLMLAAMAHLRGRGAEVMGIDWTGIGPFYEKLGFTVWTRAYHLRG